MENYNIVLDYFVKNDKPLNATAVAEGTGLDKKEVSKVMDKLKKEEKIYSPKRCYWQIKTVKKFQFLGFSLVIFRRLKINKNNGICINLQMPLFL